MIQVKNLIKVFGTKVAVDDVSFSVEKGEVLGFLGPNGAGKSTTMRMVTGYFRPTSGSVQLRVTSAEALLAAVVPTCSKHTVLSESSESDESVEPLPSRSSPESSRAAT